MRSILEDVTHKYIDTNGIKLHFVEVGTGPTVLLLHGFPEFWYSWRYQIPPLVAAGFRVVAPDIRGFGESDAPDDVDKYTTVHVVEDLVGLLDFLQVEQVLVVSHDFGALFSWQLCLHKPDRVKAVVVLSVPYVPRGPISPTERASATFGPHFYQTTFQAPNHYAESIFASVKEETIFKSLLLRTETTPDFSLPVMVDEEQEDVALPDWFTSQDLCYYSDTYRKTGFTGGFNHYRAMDKSWELQAPFEGAIISTPCLFIAAERDLIFKFPGTRDYVMKGGLKTYVPNSNVAMVEAAHFMHQEKKQEVNKLIINFLLPFKTDECI